MANVTDMPYIFLDTTGAIKTDKCQIIGIFWVSDQVSGDNIAADDDFLLSDKNGNRIIGKRATTDGDDLGITPCKPLVVDGLTLTTMDGGVCYIWVA